MKYLLYACIFGLMLASPGGAFAADASGAASGSVSGKVQQAPAKAQPDTPAKIATRNTPVTVIHEGNDSIGARAATRLKEIFNSSNLFKLEEKDVPKIRLLLKTETEIPSRPGAGSVYSVTWVFSQSDAHLGYLLMHDLGVLTADDVESLCYNITERTDGIGVKYGYLFK